MAERSRTRAAGTAGWAFLALCLGKGTVAFVGYWVSSGGFSLDHPSFYTGTLPCAALALTALVACFVPFDRPELAPWWGAPLGGLPLGAAVAGAFCFPLSFAWLAPLLLLDGLGTLWLGRVVARRAGLAPETPWPVVGLCALLGAVWTVSLRPPLPGARPLPIDATVRPLHPRPAGWRGATRVELLGDRVGLTGTQLAGQVRLSRGRVTATLRGQTVSVEPLLYLDPGSLDGFLALPWLNTYRLEPRGPGRLETSEGAFEAGTGPAGTWGFVGAELPHTKPGYQGLAALLPPRLGGGPQAGQLSGRVEVFVRLDPARPHQPPLLLIDGVTRLEAPLYAQETSLGWIKVSGLSQGTLTFGLNDGHTLQPPPRAEAGRRLLIHDGDLVRSLSARRNGAGPFEVETQGEFEDWFLVSGGPAPLLVVFPDWRPQASLQPSRAVGYGLRENALVFWRDEDSLTVVLDPASTRIGPGRQAVRLPAGIYRSRLGIAALRPGDDPRAVARTVKALLGPPLR